MKIDEDNASESDTEMHERHVSPTPHDAMLTRWRSRVASRSSPITSTPEILLLPFYPIHRQRAILIRPEQDIPIGQLYRTHPGGPCRVLIARKSVRPLPSYRLALRYTSHHLDRFTSGSSSDHSSAGYSPTDHTSATTLDRHSHSSSHSMGPSRKRCMTSDDIIPSYILASGALVPTRADLLPPQKMFRDSISPEDSVEEDIEAYMLADIEADATNFEVTTYIDVEAEVNVGIGMEVDVGVDVEYKFEDEAEDPTAPIPPVPFAIVAPSTDIISLVDAPPRIHRQRAILIRPEQDIPIGQLYRTHPGGPCRVLIARKLVRPLPSYRLALRYTSHHLDRFTSGSSSDHSSADYSPTDHTSDIHIHHPILWDHLARDVEAKGNVGIGMEVDVGVDVEYKFEDEAESSDRSTVEVRVDVVDRIDIPNGILMPNNVERLEQIEEHEEEQHETSRHPNNDECESR
nr:hypothetical protein [Tanacetum cinerariifolium]